MLTTYKKLTKKDETVYVYVKEVTPVDDSKNLYSYAFAVLNHGHETTVILFALYP